jgi:hypothetical protein
VVEIRPRPAPMHPCTLTTLTCIVLIFVRFMFFT